MRVTESTFDAPMQEIYDKWCVAEKAKLDAREAPYRKVLKSGKLKLALEHIGGIRLPGVDDVTPARLAAANVWFIDSLDGSVCKDDVPSITVYRFEFSARQDLKKRTEEDFCGTPPASAYQ